MVFYATSTNTACQPVAAEEWVRNGDAIYRWTEDGIHTVVDAEDALIAALKVKMQRPAAEILYVRRANRRGDARNPAHALKKER